MLIVLKMKNKRLLIYIVATVIILFAVSLAYSLTKENTKTTKENISFSDEKSKTHNLPLNVLVSDSIPAADSTLMIIGKWVSKDDKNWTLEFKSDSTCVEKYADGKSTIYNISMSNTTPQCGHTVDIDQYTMYISMTQADKPHIKVCYLLNGRSGSSLSLSPIDSYKVFLFNSAL